MCKVERVRLIETANLSYIRDMQEKAYEKKLKENYDTKIDFKNDKLKSLSDLEGHVKLSQSSIKTLIGPGGTFDEKSISIDSTDVSETPYILNASAKAGASTRPFEVAVQQVAKKAKAVIAPSATTHFTGTSPIITSPPSETLTINITTTINGVSNSVARNITINSGDTTNDLMLNINNSLRASADDVGAELIGGDIHIIAKETGNVTITTSLTGVLSAYHQTNDPGLNAIIHAGGAPIEQASNYFQDVKDGVSFTIAKANTANPLNTNFNNLNYSTIKTTHDGENAKAATEEVIIGLNNLSHFVTQQQGKVDESNSRRYSRANKSTYKPEEALKNTMILTHARNILDRFLSQNIFGAEGANEINMYKQLGLDVKDTLHAETGIKHKAIYIKNTQTFNDAFENKIETVKRFFVSHSTVIPNSGTNISRIYYIPDLSAHPVTSAEVIKQNIQLTANFTSGALNSVVATLNGASINAVINSDGHITFTDPRLKSLLFGVTPRNANGNEHFTMNHTLGAGNAMFAHTKELRNETGTKGYLVERRNTITKEATRLNREKETYKAKYAKDSAKLNHTEQKLRDMEQRTEMFLANIEAAFGFESNK